MKYIKGFDSLRCISIILVLLTHSGLYEIIPHNDFFVERLWPLISGLTGVQIFFSLSGFLISYILIKEKINSGTINLKFFYIKRFLRLLPPLIIFYIILLATMLLHYLPFNKIGILFSIFYCYNFIPNFFYTPELGHTWSLAVEEQFYLLWPFLLLSFRKIKTWLISIFVILLLCIYATYFLPNAALIYKGYKYLLKDTFHLERWFMPACAPIMIGSLFAILISYSNKFLIKILSNKNIILIFSFSLYISPLYLPQFLLGVESIFQAVGISLFLSWIFFNQNSLIVLLLNNPIMTYIGKISYSIYVYQGFFLRTGPGGILKVQQFPLNIILTLLIAFLSYEFIEKKVLKFKTKFNYKKVYVSI